MRETCNQCPMAYCCIDSLWCGPSAWLCALTDSAFVLLLHSPFEFLSSFQAHLHKLYILQLDHGSRITKFDLVKWGTTTDLLLQDQHSATNIHSTLLNDYQNTVDLFIEEAFCPAHPPLSQPRELQGRWHWGCSSKANLPLTHLFLTHACLKIVKQTNSTLKHVTFPVERMLQFIMILQ